jgi:predicted RNA binding protein YcfA (HicA-like mRNA interferase family)
LGGPVWAPRHERELIVATAKSLLRFLHKHGYREQRQTGSHIILKHASRPMLVVPFHRGDLPRGLFLRILKDAGFSEHDFLEG